MTVRAWPAGAPRFRVVEQEKPDGAAESPPIGAIQTSRRGVFAAYRPSVPVAGSSPPSVQVSSRRVFDAHRPAEPEPRS